MKNNNKSSGRRRKRGGVDPFGGSVSGSETPVNNENANVNSENKPDVKEQMNQMGDNVKNEMNNALSGAKTGFSNFTGWFTSIIPKKSTTSQPSQSPVESNQPVQNAGKRSRKRGGGYKPSVDYNLASSAAQVSGIKTVSANAYVGGKRHKRRNSKKTRKSRKTRKH